MAVVGAAAAMAVSMTGVAAADPAVTPTTPATPQAAPTLSGIPGDAELADLLRTLKSSGGAEQAIAALSSIIGSSGQLDPHTLLSTFGVNPDALDSILPSSIVPPTTATPTTPALPAAPAAPSQAAAQVRPTDADALSTLQKITGTQMLTPAIAPFCTTPTDDNPLGLVTAPTVAIPGPWPVSDTSVIGDLVKGIGGDQLLKLLDPAATAPLQEVEDGQVAYALVPPTTPGSSNLNVAWFNTSTMQGGMEPLKPLADDTTAGPLLKALTATGGFHGVRLARASTGDGTVLSAVFGTTTTAGRTCYFLPALGAVKS
ncbi:hypothetical protein nbrc107696_42010 [Gordonia spumicola]|uniref:Secreted protein n=1 Tax=Gordonia spumicola TaxID=589161 RepID=A0A7I9VEN8_9ACTN|nr:hypothetical protein nbrc107696_42010 [Gordonia spumicola]